MIFAGPKVVVFLDGCFWHACPDHFKPPKSHTDYWEAKIQGNQNRDKQVDELLSAAGWLVIRVWEHEDPQAAAVRIAEAVRRRREARSGGNR